MRDAISEQNKINNHICMHKCLLLRFKEQAHETLEKRTNQNRSTVQKCKNMAATFITDLIKSENSISYYYIKAKRRLN